jgi:hypothetical protein
LSSQPPNSAPLDPLSQRLLRLAGLLAVLLVLVFVNSLVNSGDDEPPTPAATATAPPASVSSPSTPAEPARGTPAPDPAPIDAKPSRSDPVAAAAKRLETTSARMSLNAVFSSPALPGPLIASGTGAYNARTGRGRTTLDLTIPNTGEPIRAIEISDDEFEYEGGDSLEGDLPPGKEWVRTKKESGDDEAEVDFGEAMEMLSSTARTRLLGRESINGTMTRHYRGEITIGELVDFMRKEGKEAKADAYQRLQGRVPTQIRIEGWVDDQNRLRRMRMVMPMPGDPGEPPITGSMQINFFAFGSEPDIQVPDPDTVVEGPLEDDEGAPAPASVS